MKPELKETFGDYVSPMDLYLRHSYGRLARLAQIPQLRAPAEWFSRTFRMAMVVNRKQGERPLAPS